MIGKFRNISNRRKIYFYYYPLLKQSNKKFYFSTSVSSKTESNDKDNINLLGSYLAGLIEGDGSIIVPSTLRNEKGKLLYPRIKITFVSKDLPLAQKLIEVPFAGKGTIEWSKNKSYLNLLIQDTKTLYFLASIINGKMRTPKIEALHRLIQWLNKRQNSITIPSLGLDKSNLGSNAWLSGFIDSDGNFYSQFSTNKEGICNSIRYYMRISQRKIYHRTHLGFTNSYFYIMDEIKNFLLVSNIIDITREKDNYIESAYEIRTVKRESCFILINYLNNFPLISSKHLDFLAWSKITEINTKKQYKELNYSKLLFTLKNSMNEKRVEFNWDHLNNFYKKD